MHATENKHGQAPSVGPYRLALHLFALCAGSFLQAHLQMQAWIPTCFERSSSASKSNENSKTAATRHVLHSIGWGSFSQEGKVSKFWEHASAIWVCHTPERIWERLCHDGAALIVVRTTMHLARHSHPIFTRIWPFSRHDSVVKHWLYHILYRNSSVADDLKETKYLQMSAQGVTRSFKINAWVLKFLDMSETTTSIATASLHAYL